MASCPDPESQAKKLQNISFKAVGSSAVFAGIAGFTPSLYKMLTDCIWSVSHDAPHTDTDFLLVHGVFMVFWILACLVQLWSGGVAKRRLAHRVGGWLGSLSLAAGMLFAACNMVKYDWLENQQVYAGSYTLMLLLAACFNLLLGLQRAIRRRFAEHKDYMLMAIMMSLDPAIHRLSMWCIRWGSGKQHLDADNLLMLGKMPANFLLIVAFGSMAVRARRVNCVTLGNLSLQLLAFALGAVAALARTGECEECIGPRVYYSVLFGTALLLLVLAILAAAEFHLRSQEASSASEVSAQAAFIADQDRT